MIADDLTGAADCVSRAAANGLSAAVVLCSGDRPERSVGAPEVDLLSMDLNTRNLSSDEAAKVTAEVVESCLRNWARIAIFKKVDSTLRGNVAAELAAVLRAARAHSVGKKAALILAPALPAQGRTTVGGRQLVCGRPLHETDLWKSETRVPRASIAEYLCEADLSSHLIDLAAVRSGLESLRLVIDKRGGDADIVVCDAETDDDLRAIAEASIDLDRPTVWAGSAGLASQLALAMHLRPTNYRVAETRLAEGPTLFVVGSAAAISRTQAARLAELSDVLTIRVSANSLLDPQALTAPIIEGLRSGHDVLMMFDESDDSSVNDTPVLTGALAQLIASCAQSIGGLVATGGETARAVLDALAIDHLRVLGEVEPGLPFSVAEAWMRRLPVLTKAGAFGARDTLVRCREYLKRLERTSPRMEQPNSFASRDD